MKIIGLIYLICLFLTSCKDAPVAREIIWVGNGYIIPDDHVARPGIIHNNYLFHLIHFVHVTSDGNCRIIQRDRFNAPIKSFEISLNQEETKKLMDLSRDSSLDHYKKPTEFPPEYLYCGHKYSIFINEGKDSSLIHYMPVGDTTNLLQLHLLFGEMVKKAVQVKPLTIDTMKLVKFLEHKINGIGMLPPMERPSVEYVAPK